VSWNYIRRWDRIRLICQPFIEEEAYIFSWIQEEFLRFVKEENRFVPSNDENVVARRFPLKYKTDGLFYTDCGGDRDPLMHTYNHHDDEFPNPNTLMSVSSYKWIILSVIFVYVYSILNLKKIKAPFLWDEEEWSGRILEEE